MGFIDYLTERERKKKEERLHKLEQEKKVITDENAVLKAKIDEENKRLKLTTDKNMIDSFKKYHINKVHEPVKKGIFRRLMDFFRKPQDFLVLMELRNKEYTSFITDSNKNYFMYDNSAYVIDTNAMEWNETQKCYFSFYHQDISFPLKIMIDVMDIKKKMENTDHTKEYHLSTNPRVLGTFIKSEFIEKTAKGGSLESDIGFIKMITLINLIISIVMIIIVYKK